MQRQYDLLILVDATASMGTYLTALKKSLPQILAVSALTGSFSRIGLLAYRDYDQAADQIIEWSGWQDDQGLTQGKDVVEMAANLMALPGYSVPEALKTGLAKAYEVMSDEAETLILLYADAPPHQSSSTERAAKRERKALSQPGAYNHKGSTFLQWPSACKAIANKARVISILDFELGSDDIAYFTELSTITGGIALSISGSQALESSISQVTMDILLTWMGVTKESFSDKKASPLANRTTFQSFRDTNPESISEERLILGGWKLPDLEALALKDIPRRSTPVRDFSKRYMEDESYKQHVAGQLLKIIETDVSAISLNPIFGSLWRTVCNDRNSEHRDGLTTAFGLAIDRLQDAGERARMKEWLEQSYDFTGEVLALIEGVPQEQRYPCVCFDPTLDFSSMILSETVTEEPDKPVDTGTFTRQDLLEIGRSCDRRILRRLGNCLTRLTYIDSESEVPPHIAASELENFPRIPLALAKKEHGRKFWKILLHLVVPGTMLSARPAAVLAALSLKMGVRPLMDIASEEMMLWRDRWTESLDNPETWNIGCLSLLLDANQAHRRFQEPNREHDGQNLLKDADVRLFEKFVAYKMLEINFDTTLIAKVGWTPNRTSLPIGPVVRCICCNKMRSVTIMGPGFLCGLCFPATEKDAPSPAPDGFATDEQSNPAWIECNVKECQGQYVLYRPKSLNVRPKCFHCRLRGSDNNAERAPVVQCCSCLNRMIYPEEYRPEGFKAESWLCVACESGRVSVIETETTARKLTAENGTSWILANEGPLAESFGANRSLFYAVSTLGLDKASALEILPDTQQTLFLAGKPLHNTASVREQYQHWINNRKAEQGTCTLCFSTTRKSDLRPACGRKGCTQRLDQACLSAWYGLNHAGCTINTAALHCPFCRRAPTAKTLATYGTGIHAVQNLCSAITDQSWIWAWCHDCGTAKQYVERVCAAGVPELRDWRCDDCVEAITEGGHEAKYRVMSCPGCQQPTEKTGGCNHIRCTICDSHWCFVCAWVGDERTIYSHMSKEHGGFFDADLEPDVDEMEWDY